MLQTYICVFKLKTQKAMSTFVGTNDVYAHVRFCINVPTSLADGIILKYCWWWRKTNTRKTMARRIIYWIITTKLIFRHWTSNCWFNEWLTVSARRKQLQMLVRPWHAFCFLHDIILNGELNFLISKFRRLFKSYTGMIFTKTL